MRRDGQARAGALRTKQLEDGKLVSADRAVIACKLRTSFAAPVGRLPDALELGRDRRRGRTDERRTAALVDRAVASYSVVLVGSIVYLASKRR